MQKQPLKLIKAFLNSIIRIMDYSETCKASALLLCKTNCFAAWRMPGVSLSHRITIKRDLPAVHLQIYCITLWYPLCILILTVTKEWNLFQSEYELVIRYATCMFLYRRFISWYRHAAHVSTHTLLTNNYIHVSSHQGTSKIQGASLNINLYLPKISRFL